MSYVHVAHDCEIGDNVIIANLVQLAGHVSIDDWVIIEGTTQFNNLFILENMPLLLEGRLLEKMFLPM